MSIAKGLKKGLKNAQCNIKYSISMYNVTPKNRVFGGGRGHYFSSGFSSATQAKSAFSSKIRSFLHSFVAVVSITGSFSIAHSADDASKINKSNNLFVSLGTAGGSISFLKDLSPKFGIKFDAYGTGNVTQKVRENESRYNLNQNNKGLGIMGYIKPFNNSVRLEVGAYYIKQLMSAQYLLGSGSGVFGGQAYSLSSPAVITYNMERKQGLRPYLGIGWSSNALPHNISLNFDVGAIYVGKFRTQTIAVDGGSGLSAASINREMAEVENNLNQFGGFWPMLKFGIGVAF